MKQAPLTVRRWKRVEYERLVDLGAFEDGDPVELIGGQLIVAEPKGSEHATGVEMAGDALRPALPTGWIVRGQLPSSCARKEKLQIGQLPLQAEAQQQRRALHCSAL